MEDREQTKTKLKPHPKSTANFLSHFFFCWELPLFVKGWKKELTENDLYTPLKEYKSEKLGDEIEELWKQETKRKKPSLQRVLFKLFGWEYMIYGVLYLPAELAIALLQPYFLDKLLEFYSEEPKISVENAYFYALGLIILCFLRVFSYHWFTFQTSVIGMKIRIACSSLIYRSSLKLKKTTFDKITIGQIVNLLSNDVSRFNQFGPFLHSLWIGPIELILGSFYIDKTLGHAAISGVSCLILCLLIQLYMSKQLSKFRRKVAEKTDYRIRLMNDIICGIQAIKFYTWEKPFSALVQLARKFELTEITRANHFRLFNNSFKIYLSKLCVFLCILTAVLTQKDLTPQYLFTLSSIYESFKLSISIFIPFGITMLAETSITIQRIQEFLLHDFTLNVTKPPLEFIFETLQNLEKKPPKILLRNVSIRLKKSQILTEINFSATSGQLIAITGKAGSGKSTLLQVILGEIAPVGGFASTTGNVSYAPQEAWIFSSSVRQNIIFGEDYNSRRYLQVVKACALEADFSLFPHGDRTLVGDRGVMLSGGQKARINLARAVYKNSDFYLLDDPLSAVDSHVAKWIYDECILKHLNGKCVILVTHQTQFLYNFDKLYVMEGGKMKCTEKITFRSEIKEKEGAILKNFEAQKDVDEHRSVGSTDARIYKNYCKAAGSYILTVGVLVLFALGQLFGSLGDFFVTLWVKSESGEFYSRTTCLYVYTGLTLLMVLVIHLASMCFTFYCMRSSKILHNNMLKKIVKAPIKFFNQHSSGRILNRFSKDVGCIDESLPTSLMNIITAILTGAAIMIIIIILNYWMIFPTIFLLVITVLLSVLFQPSNRNIKRTEGITQSFIFSHMSATIQGLQVIKSSNCQKTLTEEFDNHQDVHTSAFYLFTAMFSAFGFWADILAAFYTTAVIWGFFLLESTNAGDVGLAITQCIGLVGMVQYGMKTWSELDAYMTSVERVVDYSELQEEIDEGKYRPGDKWSTSGNIIFDSVTLKYNPDGPEVLQNVSFRVTSGEKIGIVGRTGAGKSSLISVLFRLFPFEGTIRIDRVDTKILSLDTLRSQIAIIPQEPVLFLGTLRKNLDPFDEFSDEDLWKALEELDLKDTVSHLSQGLQSEVAERGGNFSVGQRQLLCLARALLRKTKIIVFDEATANVDLKTDDLIQKLIRKKFRQCTVLTIAHRLNTVIDSDKILVMDAGRVVEFGHPYKLLQNPDGFFYKYVAKNGEETLKEFLEIAKNS